MKKTLIISESDNIAALLENDRVVEFFVNRGELLLGDVYTATVENILPGIDAAFVNLGKDKMGFLHANDVPGTGSLKEKLVPKQKLLVQITKEPTGHKGPRVSTAVSLPGRFLVLVPEERGVSISRRIAEAKERARLKAVVNLIKPPGVGIIIRTEAKGQGEQELFEDFELLWDRWQTIVSDGEASIGPTLIYRDQDLLFRVIRDAYSNDVSEILVDTAEGQKRALDYMQGWASRNTKVLAHVGEEPLLIAKSVDKEIEAALSDRAELPSGGHLNIQPTEALTVIDVNSGRFTSSRTQAETVRRTNLEAAQEIPRQLRLRNIGGMVIVDFIDMDSRRDQQQVLEQFQRALEDDRAKPQIGQLSDLGLVELTRRRQGQSLRELFTHACQTCTGLGVTPTLELGFGDHRRVLSFKPKDEDIRGRRQRGGRPQSSVLKAVTASSGRIKPIVEDDIDEEELEQLPEEILQQVPDDILGHQHGFDKTDHLDLDEEEEVAAVEERKPNFKEGQRQATYARSPLYTGGADKFDRDDEEDAQPGSGAAPVKHEPQPEEPQATLDRHFSESSTASEHSDRGAQDDSLADQDSQDLPEASLPDSPYETEIDPVTGIYRLKARANEASMHSTIDAGTSGTAIATAEAPLQGGYSLASEPPSRQNGQFAQGVQAGDEAPGTTNEWSHPEPQNSLPAQAYPEQVKQQTLWPAQAAPQEHSNWWQSQKPANESTSPPEAEHNSQSPESEHEGNE